MANKISNTDDILELGEKNIIEEENKKKKKKLVFPVILMIVGMLLMVCGLFFKEITGFLGIDLYSGEAKEKKVDEVNEIFTCNYKQTDESLGFTTEIENKYTLIDKKLVSLRQKKVIKTDSDKEFASDNLKILIGKYDDLINQTENSNGINIEDSLKEDTLTVTIDVDFKSFDVKAFPTNDLVSITNYYNQERKSIKEVEVKAGHLCK